MRYISKEEIITKLREAILEIGIAVDKKTQNALSFAASNSCQTDLEKTILDQICDNDLLAIKENIPACQDTGVVVCYVELGVGVSLEEPISLSINEAVREAYQEGYFRKSVVSDPLNRINTKDNTPAVVHLEMVEGDKLKIKVALKGAGSENMSCLKMLVPASGEAGVIDFVVDTVKKAGGKACPPYIVGVGIGGNFEEVANLAKKALYREIDDHGPKEPLELLIKDKLNELNIGPMGLGGGLTALAVKIETYPCHIASLPVAVNLCCHSNRHKEVII